MSMNTPHVGSFRGTRFFTRKVEPGPNSLAVDCVEHGITGSKPATLEILEPLPYEPHRKETRMTEEQVKLAHAFFTMVEELYEAEHQRLEDELGITGKLARDKAHAFVKQAQDAKAALAITELESIRIQNEQIVKRSELEQLDEQIERKRIEHQEVEKLRADAVAGAQAEIASLDKTIASRRDILGRVELAAAVTEASAGRKDK